MLLRMLVAIAFCLIAQSGESAVPVLVIHGGALGLDPDHPPISLEKAPFPEK